MVHRIFLVAATAVVAFGQATSDERMHWVVKGITSPMGLVTDGVSAGLKTNSNSPPEYGPHWDGFAKRYSLRASQRATNRVLEAGIGGIWGEDPRYRRVPEQPVKSRLGNVLKMTVMARNGDGDLRPAYARFLAIPGGSFLSNTWRPDSQRQFSDVAARIALGFLGRTVGNAISEFGPDARKRFWRKNQRVDGMAK